MFHFLISLPFQTTYRISTNCPTLPALLSLKYGEYVSENSTQSANFEIVVIRAGSLYNIFFQGKKIVSQTVLLTIDQILFENTIYDPGIFALHGGSVESSGKAYLLLAPTTSGKTTLTSFLVSQGFGYLTDDCILLDRSTFQVHPCRIPLHLRPGGLSVLERYCAVPPNLQALGIESRYVYSPANSVDRAIPLGGIFFITRTDDDNRVIEMNTNERILALMNSPITNYNVDSTYLKFLSRLAKFTCQKLYYSDMRFVAEVIQHKP